MSKAISPAGELTEPAPAPVALEGAGFSVGQKTVSTPAAPEPPVPLARKSGGPSVPSVAGESAFGMNARANTNAASVWEYQQPTSHLPAVITHADLADEGASYVDGRCGNVGKGAR